MVFSIGICLVGLRLRQAQALPQGWLVETPRSEIETHAYKVMKTLFRCRALGGGIAAWHYRYRFSIFQPEAPGTCPVKLFMIVKVILAMPGDAGLGQV